MRKQFVELTGTYLRKLETDHSPPPELKREIASGYLRMAKIFCLDPNGRIVDLPAAKASLSHAERLIDAAAAATAAPDEPELDYLRGQAKLLEGTTIFVEPGGTIARQNFVALGEARASFRRYLTARPHDTAARLGLWSAEIMPARDDGYLDRPDADLGVVEADLRNAAIPVRTIAQRKERDLLLAG